MKNKSISKPKLFTCMKGYTKEQLLKDIVAGILVAVIAFPLSVALAIASGMSPERGLYSAIIGGFLVSAFGGSRVNIGGATAATVMTVFTIIEEFGLAGLAVASIMAGILLIVMGLLKAGVLLRYIPRTITLGFTAGIAMGIFSGQLKAFFGLDMGAIPVKVVDKFVAYSEVIHTIDLPTLCIGLLAMAVLILLPKLTTKIPNSLAAILVTTPIVLLLDSRFGIKVATIRSVYGELPSHFPRPELPKVSLQMIFDLVPSAVTLAILIAIVSLLACVVTDGMLGERHDSNQELIGEGIANIFCGIFGAVPVAGAVARASNNVKSGGRTPIAGMVHSVTVTIILLCMMPLAGYIPMPTLAAVLILVAYNMSNWREFVFMWKNAPRSDFAVLMVTFLAGVVVDLLFAVEIGVFLAAVLFLHRMSQVTKIRRWHDLSGDSQILDAEGKPIFKPIPEHVLVYEIEGPMFFATIDELIARMEINEETKVVVLRMRRVSTIDITAVRALENLLAMCKSKGITLIFSHTMYQPYTVMERAGFVDKVGKENFCINIGVSLDRAEKIVE
ncbi:MAG: SulP family inorganic anion transporter [Lachnospiraceae bacterium]